MAMAEMTADTTFLVTRQSRVLMIPTMTMIHVYIHCNMCISKQKTGLFNPVFNSVSRGKAR